MTTKVKLQIGQKSNGRKSFFSSDTRRFSCAGESCVIKKKCPRQSQLYKEKYRNN